MDTYVLPRFECHRSAHERLVFANDWPQAFLYVLRGDFHHQLIFVRTGSQSWHADFLSRTAGSRRRRLAAQ